MISYLFVLLNPYLDSSNQYLSYISCQKYVM